jgi:hypothetical protein
MQIKSSHLCLIFVLLGAACAPAQNSTSMSSLAMPVNAESLQAYLMAMLKAQQIGDVDTFDRLANDLRLPKPEQWFDQSFGQDQVNAMKADYDRVFEAFRSRLTKNFQWSNDSSVELRLEPRNKLPGGTTASPSAPTPKAPVKIHTFKCVMAARGKGTLEWMDSFVLVDGTLRYIGPGAFPFWVGPLTITVRKARQ